MTLDCNKSSIIEYLNGCRTTLQQLLDQRLEQLQSLKFWLCVSANYLRGDDSGERKTAFFPNKTQVILNRDDIRDVVDLSFMKIQEEVETFEQNGSNWIIDEIQSLDLFTVGYMPLRASSYVTLPREIQVKRAVVNVQNRDNRCFMWSILAGILKVGKNAERVGKYENTREMHELKFDGIEFPVKLKDIPKFTQLNNISVNVFTCNDEFRVYPIYRCKEKLARHYNLFHYQDHYSYIANFDRLLGDQTRHNGRGYYCDRCLYPMFSKQRLDKHVLVCRNDSLAAIEMPEEDKNIAQFSNYQRMLRKPLVVYADFEALLRPMNGCTPDPTQSYTEKYQEHIPCSVGMVCARSCCGESTFDELYIRTCENPAADFLKKLITITEHHVQTANRCPLKMTMRDEYSFQNETTCKVCDEDLGDDRVRDHCHICGRYRSALHSNCNLMSRLDNEVVVVMHNSRRYDTHIVMQALGKECAERKLEVTCIPKTDEDYVSFTISSGNAWRIRFIDSVQFLPASLEKLAQQLKPEHYKAMGSFFNEEQRTLLSRKGVFCYDYLDSWDKMIELNPIPQDKFYNKLNKANLSDDDYHQYLAVCHTMGTRTLQDYLELYLKVDILILADVFEEFRKFSMENHNLDPCHYSTLPGLSWEACLKMTKVKLELITDPEMYEFFENAIRGGISVISRRFAIGNNRFMQIYDPEKKTSYILYYDANNLYGWAMSEPLPVSDFRWLSEREINTQNIMLVDPYGPIGYVLEVDLAYPPHLHDEHNCYPLAPERLHITPDMVSPYSKEVAEKHGMKLKASSKLAPNLLDKKKYVVHYRNLQYYLQKGLILTKIHRVIAFKQERWMKPYIDFNTNKRKEATTDFQKNLYKFFVNSNFGKTMENVRKYKNVELVTTAERLRKVTKKVNFQRAKIFTEDLVACSVGKTVIQLNKPIYCGFTILDISKLLMFRFHYDYMRPMYGDSVKVLMTDTDSLMYHVTTERDVYMDMYIHKHLFDTSDYDEEHYLWDLTNKKEVGKMKDELSGKPADSFVGLRSKMYCLKCDGDEKKRLKGVKRRVVQDEITYEDYYEVLDEREVKYNEMRAIRSEKHRLYSISLNKKSLSCFDDKRFILNCGIDTLAYGHYRIGGGGGGGGRSPPPQN